MSKYGCYVHDNDEWVLLDDQGRRRGRLIDLDKQILGWRQKRLYEPSGWFRIDVLKLGKPPDGNGRTA